MKFGGDSDSASDGEESTMMPPPKQDPAKKGKGRPKKARIDKDED